MKAMRRSLLAVLFLLSGLVLPAQELPAGPGRAEMEKMCKQCHEIARSIQEAAMGGASSLLES